MRTQQPHEQTIEEQFFQTFGVGLDWFRREGNAGFDIRLLDLWLGHPAEGVACRLDAIFGPKAKNVVFGVIENEARVGH